MAEKPHGDKKEHGKEGGHGKSYGDKKYGPAPKRSGGKGGFIGFLLLIVAVIYSIYLQVAQAPTGTSLGDVFFGRIFGPPGSSGTP